MAETQAPARGSNAWLARQLRELAARLELDGVPHKPAAYRRAAEALETLREPAAELHAAGGARRLEEIPGVGSHIARKLAELLETGELRALERLRERAPVDVLGLLAVDGIGPKSLRTLWQQRGIRNLAELSRALERGGLEELPGFGPRRVERLRRAVRIAGGGGARFPLARARAIADELAAALAAHPDVRRCAIAGSIRRGEASVGDIDLVVASDRPERVAEFFLGLPDVTSAYGRGPQRVSVRLAQGIDADLRIVPLASFGSALLYFTGNRAHTIALRRLALAEGLKLNEYGVFRRSRRIAGREEAEVYAALGLPCIPPERRLGLDEVRVGLRGAS